MHECLSYMSYMPCMVKKFLTKDRILKTKNLQFLSDRSYPVCYSNKAVNYVSFHASAENPIDYN